MIKHIVILLLCFTLTLSLYAQDCAITNLTVTPHTLVNGTFLVDVDFDIVNPDGDVFGVVGNATNYGFFMYDTRPVTLGPLPCDGVTEWQFIVYDLGDPNCQSTFILGTVDCCTISDVVIDQIACTGSSTFNARVNLSQMNTGNVGFQVYSATGTLLGTFMYANLPVLVQNIPSVRIGTTHITLCDVGNSNCCTIVEFADPDCNKTDCEIYNLTLDTTGCDNGEFIVTLDFDQMLGGSNFTVTGNGNNYGTFPYSAFPLTLNPLDGDGTTDYEFVVTGSGPGNHCNASVELGIVSCPPGCGFENVDIETQECRGDEAYSIDIDFVPISPGVLGFSVYAQGEFLGSFSYDDVPIHIDSFPTTGDFFDELELCDNADSECCYTFEFRALMCCCCVMSNMTFIPTVCDVNDQFYVEIDFYYYNQGDSFAIGGNGGSFGHFGYDQLPVTLGPFDGDSVTYYEFLAYDLEDGFCFNGGELGIIDCDCGFESLSVDTLACTGNGTYSLLLNLVPVEVTHQRFDVYAGDTFLGSFRYADLPVIIPEFPSSGNQNDVITVCDQDNPTCCASYEFVAMHCVCEIFDIVAQTSACDTAANTFDLYLDFQWEGITQEFTVMLGNDTVGTIQGANLPDTLFGLSTNTGSVLLTICGNGHPDCCASAQFENPCQGPCSISGLTVDVSPCDSLTNSFDMYVDFDWIGDYQQFEVYMGGEYIGLLEGANLPDTIFGLTTFGGVVPISVYAFDRPDCFTSVDVLLDECRFIPCDIIEVVAVPGSCTSDTTFTLSIALSHEGFINDFVDIWAGDTYLGQFSVDSLPIVIDTFPWNGEELVSLRVCHGDDPSCCETIEFVAPYCGCDIVNITTELLGHCNPDLVTFPVLIDVEWLGDVSVFTVYADSQLLAVIDATQLPDTILSFPLPVGGLAEVTICGDNDSTCCATYSFEAPICDFCEISNVTVDTFQCTSTSTFNAWVDYVTDGFDGPLQFWADDTYLGEYSQFHPLLLVNIPESDSLIVLRICNAENPQCCAELEFQGMHCTAPPCVISDVVASVSDPDVAGFFSVTLDFEFDNVGAAFTISGNGNQYGVFTYNNVPVTLDSLQCDTTTIWEFLVQDLQNIGCLDAATVGLVYCDTTGIFSNPSETLPLDIFYGKAGASFIVPEGAAELLLWTYDGRLIGYENQLLAGDRLFLSKYMKIPGFYLVQIRSRDRVYVGKVVGF